MLLIKTNDIDEQGEISASNICRFLPQILRQLIAAVGKLKKMGFHHVIFTTDHGFALQTEMAPGNTGVKLSGDWLAVKDRCMLGSGSGGPDVLVGWSSLSDRTSDSTLPTTGCNRRRALILVLVGRWCRALREVGSDRHTKG